MGTCLFCHKPTPLFKSSGKPKKFCDPQCGHKYKNKIEKEKRKSERIIFTKTCPQCNKKFDTENNRKVFCTKECKDSGRERNRASKIEEICKQCGKPFFPKDPRFNTFCDRECSKMFYASATPKEMQRVTLICLKCKKTTKRGVELRLIEKEYYCNGCRAQVSNVKRQRKINEKFAKVAKKKVQILVAKWKRKEKLINTICAECGDSFEAERLSQKTCGEICRRRRKNHLNYMKDKERWKIILANGPVDYDITLTKLIKRDNNICHLCNKPCNENDSGRTEDGHFIAYSQYPSQDHVIAVTKGGTHTWDNIKLAHIGCNSAKRNKDITEGRGQLSFYI